MANPRAQEQGPSGAAPTELAGQQAELREAIAGLGALGAGQSTEEVLAPRLRPIEGKVRLISLGEIPFDRDTLESPVLIRTLTDLPENQFLLFGNQLQLAEGSTVEYRDRAEQSRGRQLGSQHEVRFGEFNIITPTPDKVAASGVAIKPFRSYELEQFVTDYVATTILNGLLHDGTAPRGLDILGFVRYKEFYANPESEIALITHNNLNVVTYKSWLFEFGQPTLGRALELASKGGEAVGWAQYHGITHGSANDDNLAINLQTKQTYLTDFEHSKSLRASWPSPNDTHNDLAATWREHEYNLRCDVKDDIDSFVYTIRTWRDGVQDYDKTRLLRAFYESYAATAYRPGTAVTHRMNLNDLLFSTPHLY
jgi:hypothetical protein